MEAFDVLGYALAFGVVCWGAAMLGAVGFMIYTAVKGE